MKLDIKALTLASAATGMMVYVAGAILDRTSAWGGAAVMSYIFRVDVVQLSRPLTLDSFFVGLLSFGMLFAIIGFGVGMGYNLLTARLQRGTAGVPAASLAQRS